MVLQCIDSEAILIISLVLCGVLATIVGCMFQLWSQFALSTESVNSLPGASLTLDRPRAETNNYVLMGISNAKTPGALSAEYYYITMTVLSYLAVLVLLAISISLCTLIIIWCTRSENGNQRTLNITNTLISSLKAWNREVGKLISSLVASMNRGFGTYYVQSATRKVVSLLKGGLLYTNRKIRRAWNTIITLIFSLMARLRKSTNQEVSNQADTKVMLRRQLLQANEQLSQERDKLLCVICLDAPREVLLKPCKHYCLCSNCSNELRDCPICKRGIQEMEIIYSA